MLTCEFHRVAQSWRSLCIGNFNCACILANVVVASGLRRKWPTIARALDINLGSLLTSLCCSPALTTSCSVWAKQGRQVTSDSCATAFFTLAPLSLTTRSTDCSRFQKRSGQVDSLILLHRIKGNADKGVFAWF